VKAKVGNERKGESLLLEYIIRHTKEYPSIKGINNVLKTKQKKKINRHQLSKSEEIAYLIPVQQETIHNSPNDAHQYFYDLLVDPCTGLYKPVQALKATS
jgi:hypothetical protein